MDNEKKFQAAIDGIKKVCLEHGVFIIGTCADEGIYAEISIGFSSDSESFGWKDPEKSLTNEVKSDQDGYCYVDGIGAVDK